MSANIFSSSSSNISLHPPPPSSLNSSSVLIYKCFEFQLISHIFTALFGSYILFFLPLCVFILHLGHQRWRKRRSGIAAPTSNTDLFTYNIVAMEMTGMLGSCFYCSGAYAEAPYLKLVGVYIFTIVSPGQMLLHILTCVERYLAVIHPIVYLGLKKASAVRNSIIGCVWVISFGWVGLTYLYKPDFPTTPFASLLAFSVVVTSFCSLAVLRALARPGPGDGGGDRDKVDQMKKRAFHTIMAITGALLLRFGGQLLCVLVNASAAVSYRGRCLMLLSGIWSSLPSSYVLPLLFLHRAGKLPCFKYNTESGRGSEKNRTFAQETAVHVSFGTRRHARLFLNLTK